VVAGDGGCEAYTVIVWGVLLSLENHNSVEAETVSNVEGNMCGPAMRGVTLCRGRRTHHARKDHVGTWEVSRSADGPIVPQGPHREGEEP
jgi:hypothetical protein